MEPVFKGILFLCFVMIIILINLNWAVNKSRLISELERKTYFLEQRVNMECHD